MQNPLPAFTTNVPKMIDPRTHAVLDYATVASLTALGLGLRGRNPRAANFAFANAAMVLASSMFTAYPGGVVRALSFQAHGVLDVLQAATLAAGPSMLGFAATRDAALFQAHAVMEMGVIAATDWNARP
jgi:hypothetical protein